MKRSRLGASLPVRLIVALILSYCACGAIGGDSGSTSGGGGEGTSAPNSTDDGGDWWDDDTTDNATNSAELCRGLMDVNSSQPIYSNDTNKTSDDSYSACIGCRQNMNQLVTLTTDNVSYVDAQSMIAASVNLNGTSNYSILYYKLCYRRLAVFDSHEIIECVSNGTVMESTYQWKKSGVAILTVHVYTSPSYNYSDLLGCGSASVIVANNYGLNLTVKLSNKVSLSNPSTEQYRIKEVMGEGAGSTEDEPFIIGNVTFISIAKLRSGYSKKVKYYYECIIRGPYFEEAISTQQHNWTMEFLETGNYSFTVHAIAVLNQALAHHAEFTGKFTILEGVSNTLIQVGNNNSIRVGSREEVTVTAEGSVPIIACWYQTQILSEVATHLTPAPPHSPLPSKGHHRRKNTTLIPVENCVLFEEENVTVFREYRIFNEVGTFQYVARFYNRASRARKNFTYHVIAGPSPAVVASSATAVVALTVIVAVIVIIIAVIVGAYIPYKRYKNRMTETADFRFVDLSETGTHWDRFKLKANQILDYIRRKRQNEKIGLVNLGSDPVPDEERRLFYGTNTMTQFAPYETL